MNLILFHENDILTREGECVKIRFAGRRYQHIRDILSVSVGDELCVGLKNGRIGVGKIVVMDEKNVELDVRLTKSPPPKLFLTVVMALPRPIVLKRLISAVASMGVPRIILFQSHRVEKSFWRSPVLSTENLEEACELGLEQARDTVMPRIELVPRFKILMTEILPKEIEGTLPLVAHPATGALIQPSRDKPTTLIMGPEGGFVQSEVENFRALGCQFFDLGERILRVETAVVAAIAKLS